MPDPVASKYNQKPGEPFNRVKQHKPSTSAFQERMQVTFYEEAQVWLQLY